MDKSLTMPPTEIDMFDLQYTLVSEFEKPYLALSKNYKSLINYRFNHKETMTKNMDFFKCALVANSSIQEFGARKYNYYSYMNYPHLSDSHLENNINAAYRHLLAFMENENSIDESTVNHMAHICCRAGSMGLSRYYRLCTNNHYVRPFTRSNSFISRRIHPDCKYYFSDQINPETRISMLKYDPNYISKNVHGCLDIMFNQFDILLGGTLPTKFNPFETITPLDIIFWCSSFILNKLPIVMTQCEKYLDKILLTQPNTGEIINEDI